MSEAAILEAYRRGMKPDPLLTVSEWADRYRVLPQKASAEPGRYRTARTPYAREIMDELSPSSDSEVVVLQKGSQIGATEIGLNWLGYVIHKAPGPMLLVWPTVELARRNSKQRLAPMTQREPLLSLITDDRDKGGGKRSSDTLLVKEFSGGTVQITGANSAVGLRSMPARYLFGDEVDGYPVDVDGEGDPIDLALKRTATFKRNRKIFLASTPTYRGESRIESAYESTDQRHYFVPCLECDHMQVLEWKKLTWKKGHPQDAFFKCKKCRRKMDEIGKTAMLERGEWRPTAKGQPGWVGFHLPSFYSPIGWYSWGQAVVDHDDAKTRGPEAMRVWTNHVLAETWEDEGEKVDPTSLLARREEYAVPDAVLVITAAVDTQDDRLEVLTCGWGAREECWLLEYRKIFGDPSKRDVWDQLDSFLDKTYTRDDGNVFPIATSFIDSGGHHTSDVYNYCATRYSRGILPIKGVGGVGRPLVSAPTRKNIKANAQHIKLFTLGVDAAKSIVVARLHLPIGEPSSIHIPNWADQEFVDQMTAEQRVVKYRKGRSVYEWVQIYPRNEVFDLTVYNICVMKFLQPEWDAIARNLEPKKKEKPQHPLQRNAPRQRVRDRWS